MLLGTESSAWVKRHLAAKGDIVHGMIICREADEAIRYALSRVQNVEFHLKEPEMLLEIET